MAKKKHRPVAGMEKRLNDKQERFCEEYFQHLNAAKAYLDVFTPTSAATARTNGSRLLKLPQVRKRLMALRNARAERTQITADYVLWCLQETAERCMQPIPVMVYNRDAKCFEQVCDGAGQPVWRYDSAGTIRALTLLARHLGMLDSNRQPQEPAVTAAVPIKIINHHPDGSQVPPLAFSEDEVDMHPDPRWGFFETDGGGFAGDEGKRE